MKGKTNEVELKNEAEFNTVSEDESSYDECENNNTNEEHETLGNTNSKISKFKIRARNVIMTLQKSKEDKLEDLINYLTHFKANNYILITKHDGPTEEHYHIYIQYSEPRTIDSRYCYGAHIEKAYGSSQKCIDYLKCKDPKHKAANVNYELIYEQGTPKSRGGRIKDVEKMDDKDLKKLPIMMYNIVKKIKEEQRQRDVIDDWLEVKDIEVEWFAGKAGTGKTYHAKEIGREYRKEGRVVAAMSFDKNGFTHYVGDIWNCELLIINEFRDSNISYKDFLEILSNEHLYNVKGSSGYTTKLSHIIITSQQLPEEIYKNVKEDREQIFRRISHLVLHDKQSNGDYQRTTYEDVLSDDLTYMLI